MTDFLTLPPQGLAKSYALQSSKGNDVPNQVRIITKGYEYFQSYNSIIVVIDYTKENKIVWLDEYYWNYSRTTSKYRNEFLEEDTETIKKKIKSGEYKLANLNG